MSITYLLTATWGLAVLVSFIGWGKVLYRAIAHQACHWAIAGGIGVGVVLVIGGMLNAMNLISRLVLMGLVTGGALLAFVDFIWSRRERHAVDGTARRARTLGHGWTLAGALAFALCAAIRYAGSTITTDFNAYDDRDAYMVFPVKMLQTGSFASDPFSERRTVSSLGGSVFLQAIVLTGSDIRGLKLVDDGVGFLMLAGIIAALCRQLGIGRGRTVFLLIVSAAYFPSFNLTSHVIPCGLFIAVVDVCGAFGTQLSAARAVLLAVITAALCILKNTYAPPAIVTGLLFYILAMRHPPRRWALLEMAASITLTGLCLVPWMSAMYRASGTAFYPLLGKGFSVLAYGTAPPPSAFLNIKNAIAIGVLALTCFIAAWLLSCIHARARTQTMLFATLASLISAGVSVVAVGYATGGCDVWRYVMPFWFAACVSFSAMLMLDADSLPNAWLASLLGMLGGIYIGSCFFPAAIYHGPYLAFRIVWGTVPILFALAFAWGAFRLRSVTALRPRPAIPAFFLACGIVGFSGIVVKCAATALKSAAHARNGLLGPPVSTVDRLQRLNRFQAAFPPEESILALVQDPFLFDFRKNQILLWDIPGGSSLPPGMPLYQGAEPLARYLQSHGIRFIALTWNNEVPRSRAPGWSRDDRPLRRDIWGFRPESPDWIDSQLRYRWDVQQNLLQLLNTRRVCYDDGENYLIDLAEPSFRK